MKIEEDIFLFLNEISILKLSFTFAEKSGVKYRLDSDDATALMDMDDGEADEAEAMLVAKAKNIADVARWKKARAGGNVPEGVLPESIVEKMNNTCTSNNVICYNGLLIDYDDENSDLLKHMYNNNQLNHDNHNHKHNHDNHNNNGIDDNNNKYEDNNNNKPSL